MASNLSVYLLIAAKLLGIIVPLLLGVAYRTLAERELMGSIQRRKGPNVGVESDSSP